MPHTIEIIGPKPQWPPNPEREQRIRDTHRNRMALILEHGTEEEQARALQVFRQMRDLRNTFPAGTWEPIEELRLPSFLITRAYQTALGRNARAKQQLENKEGATRKFLEEVRTTEAQYALCLLLGLPLDDIRDPKAAKKHGNCGSNVSCVCPQEGNYNLIIKPEEHPGRRLFLMIETGPHQYLCRGWINAVEGMHDQWVRHRTRGGRVTKPWIVPPETLRPLDWWFDRP